MKASELIQDLQRLMVSFGDKEVIYEDGNLTHRAEIKGVLIEIDKDGTKYKLTNETLSEYCCMD